MNTEITFRSDINPYLRLFVPLSLAAGVLILCATVFGQVKHGRFPDYTEIAIASLFPVFIFAIIWVMLKLAFILFPIKVCSTYLRSYSHSGRYYSVAWEEILKADQALFHGCPYIVVKSNSAPPLTIPLWIADRDKFSAAIIEAAGAKNPLAVTLQKIAA